jgi:hypothetical protein
LRDEGDERDALFLVLREQEVELRVTGSTFHKVTPVPILQVRRNVENGKWRGCQTDGMHSAIRALDFLP